MGKLNFQKEKILLTENQRKEELSVGYLHVISAHVGFSCEKLRIDMDSIDVVVNANGYLADDSTIYSPEIKMQLKASSNIVPNGNYIPFPLPIKNYNDLRNRSTSPRLLVLLLLPENQHEWVLHSIDELVIKKCVYWLNLYGMPQSNNQTSVTVQIPVNNVLSPASLHELMISASKEEL